jgi:hypothetical protein
MEKKYIKESSKIIKLKEKVDYKWKVVTILDIFKIIKCKDKDNIFGTMVKNT